MYTIKDLIFSLIITISVYSLPLWIYKLATKKSISKRKAKWITIIYAIFAYFFMGYLLYSSDSSPSGGAILLWSYINYKVLSKGAADSPNPGNNTENDFALNSGYYDCFLSDENNVIVEAKAFLEFHENGIVYLTNYIDDLGDIHSLDVPKKYNLEDTKTGITYKFKSTKNNTEKIYNLTVPGFDINI